MITGKPVPVHVAGTISVGGIGISGSAHLTVKHPTGDEAIAAIYKSLAETNRKLSELRSDTEAQLQALRETTDRSRTRDARLGILGVALLTASAAIFAFAR